jgi:hypothetical protein
MAPEASADQFDFPQFTPSGFIPEKAYPPWVNTLLAERNLHLVISRQSSKNAARFSRYFSHIQLSKSRNSVNLPRLNFVDDTPAIPELSRGI